MRKKYDEECIIQKSIMLCLITVYVNEIGDLGKGKKGNRERQDDVEMPIILPHNEPKGIRDEIGIVNRAKWWVWVWQNVRNTYLVAAASRGWATIEEVWSEGLGEATLVSDRWAAHLKMTVRGHQLCLAHLLREAVYLTELEGHAVAQGCQDWLRAVFRARREIVSRQAALTEESAAAQELEQRLNELLGQTIDPEHHPKTVIFQRALVTHRNSLLPCVYDLEIPADNNGSERAIRNVKVKEKVSGQFKTGQQVFCVLRSVIDTLRKRDLDILTHLEEIMQTQSDTT